MKRSISTSTATSMEQPNGDRDDDLLVESKSKKKRSDIEQNSFFHENTDDSLFDDDYDS
jgi:hypothetical protein